MISYYLKLAIRRWRKAPWLTGLVIVSLAVGQATSMAIMTIRHSLAADPIPGKSSLLLTVADPNMISDARGKFNYTQIRQLNQLGEHPVAMGQAIVSINNPEGTTSLSFVQIRYSNDSFFDTFDVPVERGRIWSKQEEQDGAPVLLLSKKGAQQLFSTTNPVGREVRIGETLYRVIGVLGDWSPAPRYYDLSVGAFATADFAYLPLASIRYAPMDLAVPMACPLLSESQRPADLLASECRWLSIWYQAHSTHDAQALASKISASLPQIFNKYETNNLQVMNVKQLLDKSDIVPNSINLYTMMGLAFLCLSIVNASGIQLSRVMRGAFEVGIRRALGARRADIISQHFYDTFVLALCGGVLGVTLTIISVSAIRHLPTAYMRFTHIDVQMAIGMFFVAILSCGLTAIIPAWIASRSEPARVIKGVAQ